MPAPPRRIGPSKDVVRLSEDLERLMAEDQLKQKAPKGKTKCPLCGAILEPTKTRRVRTHDNPIKGARCDASGEAIDEAPPAAKGRPKRD